MILLVYCEFCDLFIGLRVLNRYLIGIRNSDYFRIKFDGICRLWCGFRCRFLAHRHERIRGLLANDDEHVLSLLHPMIFLVYCEFRDLFIGLRVLNRYLIGIRNSDYFRIKFDGICRLWCGFRCGFGCGFNSALLVYRYECIWIFVPRDDVDSFADLHPVFVLGDGHLRQLLVRFSILQAYLVGVRNSGHLRGNYDGSSRCRGFRCGFGCGFNSALLVYRYECIWIFVSRDDVNSFADLHPVFVLGDGHLRQLLVRFSILQAYLVGVRNSGHLRGNYDGSSRCRGFGCGFGCGFNSALLVYRYECIWIFVPRDDVDSFADLHPVFVLGDGHLRQLLVRFSILQAYLVGVRNSGHLRCDNDGSSGCGGFHRGFTGASFCNIFHYPCLCIYGNINRFVGFESMLSFRYFRRNDAIRGLVLIFHHKLVCICDGCYRSRDYFSSRWWFWGADSRAFTTITAFKHII
ncbi:hypothetical protein AR158_C184L [Paramecium bursaria Chlorella virus AR158]|uniref:hypothetical protein n=1 Tax=Paramecium bursaria Chlorella virus AR158 TaxID=380598 RepID=UPI00015AA84B|nr:hypothetical protein AR158_C184L [Paramecium bursaria Chlorella virus AR158]ABU43730.1 hypothetical protein AR158_C184L [Paramecium bursaria Chlorella virus AR158]